MQFFVIFTVVSILVSGAEAIVKSSYVVFEVYLYNEEQARQLKFFGEFSNVVFLNSITFGNLEYSTNIWVPPQLSKLFRDFLICRGIQFNPNENSLTKNKPDDVECINDVQKSAINFETYHRYNVIEYYLQNVAFKYPELASLEKLGKSNEGRDLIAIKISTGGNGTKPLIFIDAGIHANEWQAPAQALYIIQQLVENPSNRYLIKNVDWIIFPVVNPDGYEFTFTVSRSWRKTRSKGINCIGTDANRNFDFYWRAAGGSSDECNETYHGPAPFSEPEARAIRDVILKYSTQMKLYISFHSHAQVILYPWGHTKQPSANDDELTLLADSVAFAIEEMAGTQYRVGSISELMYETSGDSISWAKGVAGIDLTYVIELPPAGVQPDIPPVCIKFAVAEVFRGIERFHSYVDNKYNN